MAWARQPADAPALSGLSEAPDWSPASLMRSFLPSSHCSRVPPKGTSPEKTPRVIRSRCPPSTPVSNPCPWKSVIPPARSVAGGRTALPRRLPTGERPARQEGLPGPRVTMATENTEGSSTGGQLRG